MLLFQTFKMPTNILRAEKSCCAVKGPIQLSFALGSPSSQPTGMFTLTIFQGSPEVFHERGFQQCWAVQSIFFLKLTGGHSHHMPFPGTEPTAKQNSLHRRCFLVPGGRASRQASPETLSLPFPYKRGGQPAGGARRAGLTGLGVQGARMRWTGNGCQPGSCLPTLFG